MAVNLYGGIPGSGKTYEVVDQAIIPQLATGRRVVTNVEGLKIDLIRAYIEKKFKVKPEDQGDIIAVEDADIKRASFFCGDNPNRDSIVKPGDLVVIDEAWRFWGPEQQILIEHFEYMTKHRHYSGLNKKGDKVTSDLVIINQDPETQLHKKLKALVETTYMMKKQISLGMSKQYRVDMFQGCAGIKTPVTKRLQDFHRRYDKKVYALYDSYSGGTGSEKLIDARRNIFAKKSLWLYAGLIIVFMVWSFWSSYEYFNKLSGGKLKEGNKPKATASQNANKSPPSGNGVFNQPVGSPRTAINSQVPHVSPFSQEMKITGFMELSTRRYAVIDEGNGSTRLVNTQFCNSRGYEMICEVDGYKVSFYSGRGKLNNQENSQSPFLPKK